MRYAILGKRTARPKINGRRVKVMKKAHMLHDGRTLCQAENGYKKRPRYTPIENPEPWQVCKICLGMDGEQYAEPSLSVLMGERVAEDRASETTILGAG